MALLKALHAHNKNLISPHSLADQACHSRSIAVGKQDQFIAAYGRLTTFTFRKDGAVEAAPLALDEETLFNLEDNLLLFFTGYSRSASSILKDQDSRDMAGTDFTKTYYEEAIAIAQQIDQAQVDRMIDILVGVRAGNGRLFILGVGGGGGHASRAVSDFRKICGIEAYAPSDNVSELTARVNDDGWDTAYANWLQVSRIGSRTPCWSFRRAAAMPRRTSPRTWSRRSNFPSRSVRK